MLARVQLGGFKNKVLRSAHGLFFPALDILVPRHENVLAVLRRSDGSRLIPGHNLITDAGEIYYAQRGASESPTNAFGILELASAGTPGASANRSSFTPIASTQKAFTPGYPKTNDVDADNDGTVGTNVTTYRAGYTKADFNATGISHGIITNATPGASEPILTGFAFAASFDKTANDTLVVFVNHQMQGV